MGETLDMFAGPPPQGAPSPADSSAGGAGGTGHVTEPGAVGAFAAADNMGVDALAWCDAVLEGALAARRERLKALRADPGKHAGALTAIRVVAIAKLHAYRHAVAGEPVRRTAVESRQLLDAMWTLGQQSVDVGSVPLDGWSAAGR